MAEYNQLTNGPALEGRTITKAIGIPNGGCYQYGLRLGFDTFVIFEVEIDHDGNGDVTISDGPASPRTLRTLELISEEECQALIMQQDAAWEAEGERREREQYAYLKAKFEGEK